jgi:hypothetical protein
LVSSTIYNSTFPYGYNDGAIWAGKGITEALSGGLAVRAGVVSLRFEPIAFLSQNASFPILPGGAPGRAGFATTLYSGAVDLPQRFGDRPYGRIDLGQSEARVDAGPVAGGMSTANEFWGPSIETPLILGDNAPGFPHLFVGTSQPTNVFIGSVQGRLLWGLMSQSGYATGDVGRRYSTSAVVTFSPRGLPQLELGAARFFHVVSASGKLPPNFWFRTFEGLLKQSLSNTPAAGGDDPNDNQLASMFFRLAVPGAGAEIFGEFGREDHNFNLRDLIGQPDHDAAYTLGMQRLFKSPSGDRYTVFRAEVMNARFSHLNQGLAQTIWYTHDVNGHTERGQVLGAAGALGGGSADVALTRYTPAGSTTWRLGRLMRAEVLDSIGIAPKRADVIQEVGIERMRFGRRGKPDASVGLTSVFEYNRSDTRVSPLNLNLTVRFGMPSGR